MLDRLAQLVADKLEPKVERIVQAHLDDLRIDVINGIANAAVAISTTVDERITTEIDASRTELRKQITQEILRGVKL